MLIICSECGKEVSDKAACCPNCGCPTDQMDTSNMCMVNGKMYDFSEIMRILPKVGDKPSDVHPYHICALIRDQTNLAWNYAEELANLIISTKSVPREFEGTKNAFIPEPPVPQCPKCNSTSITSGARGVNFTWGLLGASKTVNRCANCGYTWRP